MQFSDYEKALLALSKVPADFVLEADDLVLSLNEEATRLTFIFIQNPSRQKQRVQAVLGEMLWYMGHIALAMGISLEDVARVNVASDDLSVAVSDEASHDSPA